MTSNTTTPDGKPETTPDYVGLVRFLMTPFLLHPEAVDPAARHGTPRDRHPAPSKPRLRSSAPDSDLETSPA